MKTKSLLDDGWGVNERFSACNSLERVRTSQFRDSLLERKAPLLHADGAAPPGNPPASMGHSSPRCNLPVFICRSVPMLASRVAALPPRLRQGPSLRLTGTDGSPAFAYLLRNCPLPRCPASQGRPSGLRLRAKARQARCHLGDRRKVHKQLRRALEAALREDWVAQCRMTRSIGAARSVVVEVDTAGLRVSRTPLPLPFHVLRRWMNKKQKKLDPRTLPTLWDWLLVSHSSVLLSVGELLWIVERWPVIAWAGPPQNVSRLSEIMDLAFSRIRQFGSADLSVLLRHATRLGLTLPLPNLVTVIASRIGAPATKTPPQRGIAHQQASVAVDWPCPPSQPAALTEASLAHLPCDNAAIPTVLKAEPCRVIEPAQRTSGLGTCTRDWDPYFGSFSLAELSQLFRLTTRHSILSQLLLTSVVHRTRIGEHEAVDPFNHLELLTALAELLSGHTWSQSSLCGNAIAQALVKEAVTTLATHFVSRTLQCRDPYPPEILCYIIAELGQLQAILIEDPPMLTAIDAGLQRLIHSLPLQNSDAYVQDTGIVKCDKNHYGGANVPDSLMGFTAKTPLSVLLSLACALKGLRCAGLLSVSNAVVSSVLEASDAYPFLAVWALEELVALLPRDCDAALLKKLVNRCLTGCPERGSKLYLCVAARMIARLMEHGDFVPQELVSFFRTGVERGSYWPKTPAEWRALNTDVVALTGNPTSLYCKTNFTVVYPLPFNPFTEISNLLAQAAASPASPTA